MTNINFFSEDFHRRVMISTLYDFIAASPRESLESFAFFCSFIATTAMNFTKKCKTFRVIPMDLLAKNFTKSR